MMSLKGLYALDQRSDLPVTPESKSGRTAQTNRSIYEYYPRREVCVYQFSGLVQKV